MKVARFEGIFYEPINPIADNDELASRGERLMIRHGSPTQPDSQLFFAPKGELTSGWVLGIAIPQ